ncbi:DUF6768 family protein [Sphingorhabdus sp. Alg239-R122]|uniref:DUF6768 family protein n=1 Tax=Sphingorhabdus sp. Alg239-R122 TaxID=2305989 RepID=UPI0013DD3605|nr:DUF6768 family protein [Sphingorhabdus sp. Alg239-R122]
MNKLDDMLAETLSAEDQALLDEIRDEPGYFTQAFGLFRGNTGWVAWAIMIVQSIMFLAGAWMAIQFFGASDTVNQLRWGLPSAVLLILSSMFKLSLMPTMQANRVLREVRRLELTLSARN